MSSDLRALADADPLIHQPSRLVITALLYPVESADFTYLLRETGFTKGNLSAHLTRLEDAGYVEIEKTFRGKQPQTVCRLTARGRAAFREYAERLRRAADTLPH